MTRKRYTSEDKVSIIREHLENNVSVPDVCEKYRIHPNLLYRWKKELFEKAVELFSKTDNSRDIKKITELESTVNNRNEVIAELLEENLKLKKLSGEI